MRGASEMMKKNQKCALSSVMEQTCITQPLMAFNESKKRKNWNDEKN